MVTIEEKINVFSKLIYQDVENDLLEQKELKKEKQAQKLEQVTEIAHKQAQEILRANDYRIKQQRSESIGKAKIENKRKLLKAKESCVKEMLLKLDNRIKDFMGTSEYERYIKDCIQKSTQIMEIGTPLRAVVSQADAERFKKMLERYNFSIEVAQPPIKGGIIIVDPKNNTKVDFSIDTALEDMMPVITNEIMTQLGEVGDYVE